MNPFFFLSRTSRGDSFFLFFFFIKMPPKTEQSERKRRRPSAGRSPSADVDAPRVIGEEAGAVVEGSASGGGNSGFIGDGDIAGARDLLDEMPERSSESGDGGSANDGSADEVEGDDAEELERLKAVSDELAAQTWLVEELWEENQRLLHRIRDLEVYLEEMELARSVGASSSSTAPSLSLDRESELLDQLKVAQDALVGVRLQLDEAMECAELRGREAEQLRGEVLQVRDTILTLCRETDDLRSRVADLEASSCGSVIAFQRERIRALQDFLESERENRRRAEEALERSRQRLERRNWEVTVLRAMEVIVRMKVSCGGVFTMDDLKSLPLPEYSTLTSFWNGACRSYSMASPRPPSKQPPPPTEGDDPQ
ncbi:hypothetical protein QJS10_CPB13g00984 [Acorus calamus]|uniref:Uncharacterized protein n=1 Tax=Acorus calamus TaxID=4465 RepID=A0AAV9DGA1_ACOCL|nr:hypothetical protein QJS10_CPB13g00984 [Acorus calamus]